MPRPTKKTNPKPASLAAARKQLKLLEAQRDILRVTHETKLLESFWGPWGDGFGGTDLWDRVRPSSNTDADAEWRLVPPNVPSDRRHGSDWPVFRTQPELDYMRQEARLRYASSSYCKGLLRNMTNNVIGKGFAYKAELVKPKNKQPLTDADGEEVKSSEDLAVEAVQAVIDRFLKANRWNGTVDPQTMTISGSRERELFRLVKRDGEAFVRFHKSDAGLEIRIIDPSQIRNPPGGIERDGWSYGIRHVMTPYEDVETPEEYAIYWPDPAATGGKEAETSIDEMCEFVPASEILHLKGPDTDSLVKRGISDFLFDTGRALDRAGKLQSYASISAAIRAATAEIWQYEQTTSAQLGAMAGALASRTTTDPVTGQTINVEKMPPGTIRRLPQGATWVERGAGPTAEYMAGVQGDLQQASASSCSPAFWLGDTANANYSNLESAAAPAVRAGTCEQEYYKTAFAAVIWRAILFAIERDELPEDTPQLIKIHVEAPAVLHRNELEKAQEDQIAITTGWKDRETACVERGGDWEVVQANNADYQEKQADAAGMLPLEPEPGEGWGKNQPPASGKPRRPPATEVSGRGKPTRESRRVREKKDASGHEHAADGKFGTGGSSKNLRKLAVGTKRYKPRKAAK